MALARAGESELAWYVEYVNAENRILRGDVPTRVIFKPAEREPPGKKVKEPNNERTCPSFEFLDRTSIAGLTGRCLRCQCPLITNDSLLSLPL